MSTYTDASSGATPLLELSPAPTCEQCSQPFAPRERSGGKPQRFCSPECRTAFHSENRQRDQRAPTCSAITDQPATPIAEPVSAETRATLAALIEKHSEPADDFDWFKDDSIVLEEQPTTAVYTNSRNAIVIRQRAASYPDEDQFVFIAPHNLMTLIDRLCDMAGIPSAGKRR
jgi:hypothetical protein